MTAPTSENGDIDSPVYIDDKKTCKVDKNVHLYPNEYEGHFDSVMISSDEIRIRIKQLAKCIHKNYNGRRPILVCTLKGACPFFSHLSDELQYLRQGYDVEFIRASSYDGTSTTGNVQVRMGELTMESLKNRHVLLIEDIVDTGTTLSRLVPTLEVQGHPASIEVCSLLDKRLDSTHKKQYTAKYVGFSIPNHFIIGYGLDYNELYRDLKDIFVISKEGIKFDSSSLHK